MLYFRCDVLFVEIFLHVSCELFEDVMSISYYIHVIYRFNGSRALQVGIRVMSILFGPKPGELPIVFEWY